ncbi:hypothetical protein [Mammaliicoccus sciuri]|uniref:hypothetical protein n=1 Tax=Mammaliicoccus sciuri TaxID=1296 RepID=UPI001FB3A93E|nr:hypothetical protein [Mammaliicoccus sciuri]MCJ1774653.1 hypothetical protein [Mammaliicoccus sciuri]
MDKTRLVNLASDLLIKIAHSDLEIKLEFRNYDGGELGFNLIHFDDRYEDRVNTLFIYQWQKDDEIMNLFEQMKDVIAGERLITHE